MRVEAHVHIGKARQGLFKCVSTRDLPGGKVYYLGTLHLQNVTFAVQPAGLRKFRNTGQKNVHAYVRGEALQRLGFALENRVSGEWVEATYNPMRMDRFAIKDTGAYITQADEALLIGKRLYVINGR